LKKKDLLRFFQTAAAAAAAAAAVVCSVVKLQSSCFFVAEAATLKSLGGKATNAAFQTKPSVKISARL